MAIKVAGGPPSTSTPGTSIWCHMVKHTLQYEPDYHCKTYTSSHILFQFIQPEGSDCDVWQVYEEVKTHDVTKRTQLRSHITYTLQKPKDSNNSYMPTAPNKIQRNKRTYL